MFTTKYVRENKEAIIETIKRQKKEELITVLETLLKQDEEWRELKKENDQLRAERNKLSEEINKTKKAGGEIRPIIEKAKAIPAQIKDVEEKLAQLDKEMLPALSKIPNIMHPDVPYGKDDSENVEIRTTGNKPDFDFKIKNHVELCEELGIADFETSANTSGNGFYFLKGDLALLNQALIQFAIHKLTNKGYTYIEPPLMVRKHILDAAMDTAGFEETIYQVGEGDNPECLIGTAEHVILGMHENEVIKEEDLPKKYAGYSMCFRQEIGSHGINEKGLWRTHQFNKVEQFIFCLPEQTWDMYDELMKNSAEILDELDLPYRIIEICTGDLAVWKARSHDFEVWRPTTQEYGEVMSLSNCTVYQSMGTNTRFVRRNGEHDTVHTLNNTALATSRIMVAILENNQQADGSVIIPKVLRQYMGGKEKISRQ